MDNSNAHVSLLEPPEKGELEVACVWERDVFFWASTLLLFTSHHHLIPSLHVGWEAPMGTAFDLKLPSLVPRELPSEVARVAVKTLFSIVCAKFGGRNNKMELPNDCFQVCLTKIVSRCHILDFLQTRTP